MPITTCVFDAYGTLFDVAAAAREAAAEPGREAFAEKWAAVAETWRLKQLQYTWLRATAGVHTDFWQITWNGLDYALEAHGLEDTELRDRLLKLYWELSAYPEVPDMLAELKAAGLNTAILSNGSPAMLNGAVESAGIADRLDAVLSVETVGVFKPHGSVYDLIGAHFGCPAQEVLFVSSNGWDACFAASRGFRVVWANRKGEPGEHLPWQPAHTV
ncbi:MAG: haloacid dehalogenase type II, partial [Pseudomonadota bacterium]